MGLRGQYVGLAYQLKMAYECKKFLNFSFSINIYKIYLPPPPENKNNLEVPLLQILPSGNNFLSEA